MDTFPNSTHSIISLSIRNSFQNYETYLKTCTYLTIIVVSAALCWTYEKWTRTKGKCGKIRYANKSSNERVACIEFDDLPEAKPSLPLKLVGNIPQFFPLSQTANTILKWSEEHGDVIRGSGLNQIFVLLNSGPSIQALAKSTNLGHVVKPPVIYGPMKPFITNGVLVSKGAFWHHQRKLIMKTQSFQCLKSYIPMIENHSKRLVQHLSNLYEDGELHEINSPINATFIGIIDEMITGRSQEDFDELTIYHHNFSIWKEVMFKRVLNPLLLLKPIWMFHSLYKPHQNALRGLLDFAKRRLENAKANKRDEKKELIDKNRSLIDQLVAAGIEDQQIVDEINTMMFGGHETGACAIHFLCFCLASNPRIQEKAQEEVNELFESFHVSQNEMSYECVQNNLKYLERCIFETLRLFPSVPAIARKLEEPLTIEYKNSHVLVPNGVSVVICPFSLHRRKELYPDPDTFDPDRFTPEACANRHAYSYIPFSVGQRNCLGQKFAMIELKIVAAYILRHFELRTVDKLEDIPLLPYTTLTPARNFKFQLIRRDVARW